MRFPNTSMTFPGRSRVGAVALITFALLLPGMSAAAFAANDTAQPSGKWVLTPAPAGARESLVLSLSAVKPVKGWMKSYVPILTIQCSQGKAAVYIETGMALEVTAVDQQIVRVQFDGNKPVTQRWREVTNATMSARDATGVLKQLTRSQKFIFEFTPFGIGPVQAEFAVAGLADYMPQMAGACWQK